MENKNYTDQFDEMRRQLNHIKESIEKKGGLSDSHLREIFETKKSDISNRMRILTSMVFCQLPVWGYLSRDLNLSHAFIICTYVILLSALAVMLYINKTSNISFNRDVRQTVEALTKMKRRRVIMRMIGIPIIIAWVVWLVIEIQKGSPIEEPFMVLIDIVLIAAAAGIIIGTVAFRKLQRINDEMIRSLEELQK